MYPNDSHLHISNDKFLSFFLSIWLHYVLVVALRIFSLPCGMQTQLWHVGSSSQTRDQTQDACIGSMES